MSCLKLNHNRLGFVKGIIARRFQAIFACQYLVKGKSVTKFGNRTYHCRFYLPQIVTRDISSMGSPPQSVYDMKLGVF